MIETIEPSEIYVRNSETQTFKACRQRWWWAYVDHYQAKRKRPALELGTLVHASLEQWYIPGKRRGIHPAKTAKRLYMEQLQAGEPVDQIYIKDDPDDVDARGERVLLIDLAVEMLTNYVDHYGKDEEWEVLAPEQTFQVNVVDKVTGKVLFVACGQIDLVCRHRRTGKVFFVEHKTGATLAPFGAPEPLDEQSGTYWTYGPTWLYETGQLPKDEVLDHILFNRLRKQFKDKRPTNAEGHSLNKNGTVSKQQPAPLFGRTQVHRSTHDQWILDERIRATAAEMEMVKAGKLAVYKHPDRHCGYCEFRDVCEVHETGSDYQMILQSNFTQWEPYEEHLGKQIVGMPVRKRQPSRLRRANPSR